MQHILATQHSPAYSNIPLRDDDDDQQIEENEDVDDDEYDDGMVVKWPGKRRNMPNMT